MPKLSKTINTLTIRMTKANFANNVFDWRKSSDASALESIEAWALSENSLNDLPTESEKTWTDPVTELAVSWIVSETCLLLVFVGR